MKKIKGRVSAIMPTYNRAVFLQNAIDKILEVDYPDIELIIINDGSTDDTLNVLQNYKQQNIKVINLNKNSGTVCIPRNIGISHSTGEFISHCDDDIIPKKDKFKILVELLNNNPSSHLAYGDRIERRLINNTNIDSKPTFLPDWNPNAGSGVDNSQIIYRSNVYKSIPFVWVYRACDFYLAKSIYKLSKFVYTNDIVATYIWHGGNRSKTTNDKYSRYASLEIPQEEIDQFKEYINFNFFINEN
jgi:glycosyltransferase involved in cell wall biosynthesis